MAVQDAGNAPNTKTHSCIDGALLRMLQTYNELNPSKVDELSEEPSALEFMRYVSRNRPFIVRGGASEWTATRKWNAEYLDHIVGSSQVNVAITPKGNADSIEYSSGRALYVEPLEQLEPFGQVLSYIRKQELEGTLGPVKYAQTQNDNLRNEYAALYNDVPKSISWARIALQSEPDAVNFWLGNSRSISAMHKDNYENVYAQIRGQKHFLLMPPIVAPWTKEQQIPVARYAMSGESLNAVEALQPIFKDPPELLPVPTWNPEDKDGQAPEVYAALQPLRVTLNEGDMMYLPALWFHQVSQSCSQEGFSISVNYWYDMDFGGQFWTTNNLIREIAQP